MYIRQSKYVGIIAIKTERTQIIFLSDVLVAVASSLIIDDDSGANLMMMVIR